mmetsp:Transcript_15729/g.28647  ORF Transcript_15729/g.28647 Transcript_15729/m.28647 type:complete len:200 (-) Transcript_15729:303-902(-)
MPLHRCSNRLRMLVEQRRLPLRCDKTLESHVEWSSSWSHRKDRLPAASRLSGLPMQTRQQCHARARAALFACHNVQQPCAGSQRPESCLMHCEIWRRLSGSCEVHRRLQGNQVQKPSRVHWRRRAWPGQQGAIPHQSSVVRGWMTSCSRAHVAALTVLANHLAQVDTLYRQSHCDQHHLRQIHAQTCLGPHWCWIKAAA